MKKLFLAFAVSALVAACTGKPAPAAESAPAEEQFVVEEAPVADSLAVSAAPEVSVEESDSPETTLIQ